VCLTFRAHHIHGTTRKDVFVQSTFMVFDHLRHIYGDKIEGKPSAIELFRALLRNHAPVKKTPCKVSDLGHGIPSIFKPKRGNKD